MKVSFMENPITFSIYANLFEKTKTRDSTLAEIVDHCRSDIFRKLKEEYEKANEKKRKNLKQGLPAFTGNIQFANARKSSSEGKSTGCCLIDIDKLSNRTEVSNIKDKLKEFPSILVLGETISGSGIWGLIWHGYDDLNTQKRSEYDKLDRINSHCIQKLNAFLGEDFVDNVDTLSSNPTKTRSLSFDPDIFYREHSIEPLEIPKEVLAEPENEYYYKPVEIRNNSSNTELTRSALNHIFPPNDYGEWIRLCGSAFCAGLSFDEVSQWSKKGEQTDPNEAEKILRNLAKNASKGNGKAVRIQAESEGWKRPRSISFDDYNPLNERNIVKSITEIEKPIENQQVPKEKVVQAISETSEEGVEKSDNGNLLTQTEKASDKKAGKSENKEGCFDIDISVLSKSALIGTCLDHIDYDFYSHERNGSVMYGKSIDELKSFEDHDIYDIRSEISKKCFKQGPKGEGYVPIELPRRDCIDAIRHIASRKIYKPLGIYIDDIRSRTSKGELYDPTDPQTDFFGPKADQGGNGENSWLHRQFPDLALGETAAYVARNLIAAPIFRYLFKGEKISKYDIMMILAGKAGIGKSSMLPRILPWKLQQQYFAYGFNFSRLKNDDELAISIEGMFMGEVGEMRYITDYNQEGVKDWLSRESDSFRPKYSRNTKTVPRTIVLVGTSEDSQCLPSGTNRRNIVCDLGDSVNEGIDFFDKKIHKGSTLRDHLWAQALFEIDTGNYNLKLPECMDSDFFDRQSEKFSRSDDIVDDNINEYDIRYRERFKAGLLDQFDQTPAKTGFRLASVIDFCGLDPYDQKNVMRISKRLKHLCNAERVSIRIKDQNNKPTKIWRMKDLDYGDR